MSKKTINTETIARGLLAYLPAIAIGAFLAGLIGFTPIYYIVKFVLFWAAYAYVHGRLISRWLDEYLAIFLGALLTLFITVFGGMIYDLAIASDSIGPAIYVTTKLWIVLLPIHATVWWFGFGVHKKILGK